MSERLCLSHSVCPTQDRCERNGYCSDSLEKVNVVTNVKSRNCFVTNEPCKHECDITSFCELYRKDKERIETVNHPAHYGGDTTYEVIKVLEAWGLDKSFCLGNMVKHIARADKKGNKLEDLKKARFYLDREITNLEKST